MGILGLSRTARVSSMGCPAAVLGFPGSSMPLKLTIGDFKTIRNIAVFRDLKPETVEHILAPATAVMLKAHESLFRQGDPATAFFIVIYGFVKLFRITLAGEEAIIRIMSKGDSVAEATALRVLDFLRLLKASVMLVSFVSPPTISFGASSKVLISH